MAKLLGLLALTAALCSPAHAQTVKWLHIMSVSFCQDARMIRCKNISAGKVDLISQAKDSLNRPIFLANHNGEQGYIADYYVNNPLFMRDEDPALTEKKDKAKAAAAKAECERRGSVSIGMTAEQVKRSCWGAPSRVNETITARGKREQWVYRSGYIYLDNGVVSGIQTSR